ncbi:MAG TPA: phenylalanine--tRNA ligase subunit beta [Vicinamibacterales bacterium]|nr:phenylalanine--tRNA ligase subunit beta [Vicinamibacterales bacterium]
MKLLVSWLRELTDVPVTAAELASDLHLAGFEVGSVDPLPDGEDDAVIDFEITANRPDCLSVRGLAREAATKYGTALRAPAIASLGPGTPDRAGDLSVTIEAPDGCARYCGALAEVRVAPSPEWMQRRLAAAGVRAINNIVDVTNYVLLEIGQPMHAFDFERLDGRTLCVRRARAGERVRTLDGQQRDLEASMLVIADAERPQALAGIMGGADSEVSEGTRIIALESAWFEPTGIRRASRRLGLSTEASYRFERGADIEAAPLGIARAIHLLEQIGAGRALGGWVDVYPGARRPRTVTLELGRVDQTLGAHVPVADARQILERLGFIVEDLGYASNGTVWRVTVPSWRVDVARDVDLIEEIARHHGYDRLPTTFPALSAPPAPADSRLERDRVVRRLAGAAGFSESVTFSFIERRAAQAFAADETIVEILNPLSEQFAVLRPSLLPGLLEAAAYNRRHGIEDVRLFELGTIFRADGERRALGLAWMGAAQPLHWTGTRRPVDFFDMKGAAQLIASSLGVPVECEPLSAPCLVPGRAARVVTANGSPRAVGVIGQLAPALTTPLDIPPGSELYVAELDLDALSLSAAEVGLASAPPRFPAVVRDVSIVVDETLPAASVRGTIRSAAPSTLVDLREFDRYQGKGVPEGRVSLSYRLTFRAADRTLRDEEVQRAMDDILRALASAHGAVQR